MDYWGSDVVASMPVPSRNVRLVEMDGFVFTDGGMAHAITEVDYEALSTPTFLPTNGLTEVYEDADLDAPPKNIRTF